MITVPRPRARDGVGAALRDAYQRDAMLPHELATLLARLDLANGRSPHR